MFEIACIYKMYNNGVSTDLKGNEITNINFRTFYLNKKVTCVNNIKTKALT